MAFGIDLAIQLLREILKELKIADAGTADSTAANQVNQIALETAIKAVLDIINTNGSTGNTSLTAISNALSTLNTNSATAANQTSLIATTNPTTKYKIANTDTASTIQYYGFLDKDGNWYIMKNDGVGDYTYCSGLIASPYAGNWTGRVGLTYVTFDIAF
jgi:hypothetical protein